MMNMKHWTWFLTLILMKYNADFYKRFGDIIVANTVTTAPCWMSFLETMARNSKCSVQELLMIHYQRPEARDCKSYQDWISAGRRVKRGAIGITIRDKENPEKVRYLFDLVDTVGTVSPWRYSRKLEPEIMQAIQREFHVSEAFSFPAQIEYALLATETPLAQVYKTYLTKDTDYMEHIYDSLEDFANDMAKLHILDALQAIF